MQIPGQHMFFLEQFIHEAGNTNNTVELQRHWTKFVRQFGIEHYRIVPISPNIQQQSVPPATLSKTYQPSGLSTTVNMVFTDVTLLLQKRLSIPGPSCGRKPGKNIAVPSKNVLILLHMISAFAATDSLCRCGSDRESCTRLVSHSPPMMYC